MLILIAAAVLITSGVMTDAVGFLCLVPACHGLVKRYRNACSSGAVREGKVGVTVAFDAAGQSRQHR